MLSSQISEQRDKTAQPLVLPACVGNTYVPNRPGCNIGSISTSVWPRYRCRSSGFRSAHSAGVDFATCLDPVCSWSSHVSLNLDPLARLRSHALFTAVPRTASQIINADCGCRQESDGIDAFALGESAISATSRGQPTPDDDQNNSPTLPQDLSAAARRCRLRLV